jgi:hypothetical protein
MDNAFELEEMQFELGFGTSSSNTHLNSKFNGLNSKFNGLNSKFKGLNSNFFELEVGGI